MRGSVFFVLGMIVSAVLLSRGMAQESRVHGLNHVGIVVANYEDALEFYTGVMGFREAYTVRRPDGSPLLTYLQLNRDTFVELIPAEPGQQPGITHFGIEVGNIEAEVAQIRAAGADVGDPALTPAKAFYTRMHDRDGVEIEVMEFGPDALQRKAIDAWR